MRIQGIFMAIAVVCIVLGGLAGGSVAFAQNTACNPDINTCL